MRPTLCVLAPSQTITVVVHAVTFDSMYKCLQLQLVETYLTKCNLFKRTLLHTQYKSAKTIRTWTSSAVHMLSTFANTNKLKQ